MTEYEFTDEENQLFDETSNKMVTLSMMAVISGILSILITILSSINIFFLIAALSIVIFGLFFYLPVDNFRRISTTEEYDISELVQGYRELNTGWGIVLVIVVLGILNSLIQIILAL